jgi:hypothetical protein
MLYYYNSISLWPTKVWWGRPSACAGLSAPLSFSCGFFALRGSLSTIRISGRLEEEMTWSRISVGRAVVVGAVVASLTILSPVLRAQSTPTIDTKAPFSQLEHDVPDLLKKCGVPGVAIAVIRGGKTTWVRGFGVKNAKIGQRNA